MSNTWSPVWPDTEGNKTGTLIVEEYRSADSNIARRNIGLLTVTLLVEEYRSTDSNTDSGRI